MSERGNEPAYPVFSEIGNLYHYGMTKREVIAMHLEAALITGSMADGSPASNDSPKILAETAVIFADALLEALS